MVSNRQDDVERIQKALEAARNLLARFDSQTIRISSKGKGGVVTEADHAVDELLRESLPREGEGWLSEETADDRSRLQCSRVWIVDPLDGTHEFVSGIHEWAVSIGLIEEGQAVAGGVCNPATGETVIGSAETGVTFNGRPAPQRNPRRLQDVEVLASRSETNRGEWDLYLDAEFRVRPVGSVAYKLALVAAGLADATWTLAPKNEWDVAGGVALVRAAGGVVRTLDGQEPVFNRSNVLLDGLWAFSAAGYDLLAPVVMNGVPGRAGSESRS